MKPDKVAFYVIIGLFSLLALFGLISISTPGWLHKIAVPGRETEAKTYADKANQKMYKGNFSAAVAFYKYALNIDSDNREIYGNLGIAYTKLKQFDLAKKSFNEVKRLSQGLDSIAWFNYYESMGNLEKSIGEEMQKTGRDGNSFFNKALNYYSRAVKLMPHEPVLEYKYAHLLMTTSQDNLATHHFIQGISKNQDKATYYYAALMEEYLPAIAAGDTTVILPVEELLKKPIDWKRFDTVTLNSYQTKNLLLANAYVNLGELNYRNGYKQKAESYFAKAIFINPKLKHIINKLKAKYQ